MRYFLRWKSPLSLCSRGISYFLKLLFAAKTGLSRDDIVSLANVNKGRNVTFWPFLINGMKTSGKKRDNLGSIGKSFRRGCNSIAESATKKEGNQPSFFVGG